MGTPEDIQRILILLGRHGLLRGDLGDIQSLLCCCPTQEHCANTVLLPATPYM